MASYGNSFKWMELWIDLEIAFFVKNHPPCPSNQMPQFLYLLLTQRLWAVGTQWWIQGDLSCGQNSSSKLSFLPSLGARWKQHGHVERALGWKTPGWAQLWLLPQVPIKLNEGTSPVVQWLRLRLPMQGTLVRSLVRELSPPPPHTAHCSKK